MGFEFDADRLVKAAIETGAAPLAIEEGTGLAEYWISKGIVQDKRIVAVECGFVNWLDEWTVIVGVQDLLTSEKVPQPNEDVIEGKVGWGVCDVYEGVHHKAHCDSYHHSIHGSAPEPNWRQEGIVGNEWKTTKEQTKWWNEDKWLESITDGSQIAVYALALQSGTYYPKHGGRVIPAVGEPRIRVRAISKSNPPVVWPRDESDGIITFSPERLNATKQALLSAADSIRVRRKRTGVWGLPGIHCTNQFKRLCEFHQDCTEQVQAETVWGEDSLGKTDPARTLAIPHIGEKVNNPELVILSASSFQSAQECVEKYRRSLVAEDGESSMALDTGSVFHSVVAESYRQIQESLKRRKNESETVIRDRCEGIE